MFEGIVGKLIGQYLSEFLEDFDPSQLKIGLWDGKLELHHLKLNPSLLAARNIPFAFKASSVGLLRIEVPMISWSKGFFNDPLRISLANVVVTVVQSFRAFDRVVYAEKMERIKQSAIEALNEKIPSSFTASNLYYQHKLLQKLIDNIEISVEDVQVTYESPCGRSIGFSFDSFSLFTCNSLWEPAFQREAHDQVYKMIKMVGLRVEAKNLDEEVDSILKPLDASVKVVLHKPSVPDMNHSKVKANILVPSLSATLHQYQFALVLDVAHYVAVKQKREHFSGLPSPKERPDKDPAAWWRLAASDILQGIRKRRARFHPDVMLERKKNKRKYVKAFQEQVLSGKPNPEVTDLEKQLSIADIIYFRALSNVSLDRRATEPTKSWFQSSWFGGASPISIGEWLPSHDLSAAEKLALKKALELPSAPPMPPCDLPKDYVQVDLGMEVGSISLLLKEDRKHGIVRLSSSAILSSCVLRPTSMTAAFEVGDIQVQNLLPTAPGYDQMVIRSRELGCTAQVDSPLLSMRVDVAPIERDADFGVELIAPIPLDILIDSRMINKLIAFGLGTVKQRMRGFIEFGLKALKENIHIQGFVHDFSMKEEPVRVHLLVDAYTPRLIFPQDIGDCTKPSLLLHAGCFRFESRLDHLNDGKPENLDLSDQYQFNISGMRAALSPYSPLADRSIPQDHYMVPPLNISIQMSVLRPAATPQLAKVGLKVHVPAVAANIRLNEMQDIVGIIVGIVDDIRLAVLAVDDDYFYLQELVGVGVEKSEEALSRFTDNKLQQGKWKKVMLSVEANVPKITVILRDNLASSHVHTICFLQACELAFQLKLRKYDLSIYTGVRSFIIRDGFRDSKDEYHDLLSTRDEYVVGDSLTKQSTIFKQPQRSVESQFKLYYYYVASVSPDYLDIDHELNLIFNRVHINFNRESMVHLTVSVEKMVDDIVRLMDERERRLADHPVEQLYARVDEALREKRASQPLPTPVDTTTPNVSKFRLTGSLNGLSVILNTGEERIGLFRCHTVLTTLDIFDGYVTLLSSIGSLHVCHEDEATGVRSYVDSKGSRFIELSVQHYTQPIHDGRNFTTSVQYKMQKLEIVYERWFWDIIPRFFTTFHQMRQDMLGSRPTSTSEPSVSEQPSLVKVCVILKNPTLILPEISGPGHLEVDLGEISAFGGERMWDTAVQMYKQTYNICGEKMRVKYSIDGGDIQGLEVDIGVSVFISNLLGDLPEDTLTSHPPSAINIFFPHFQVGFNEEAFGLVLRVFQSNIMSVAEALIDEEEKAVPPPFSSSANLQPTLADTRRSARHISKSVARMTRGNEEGRKATIVSVHIPNAMFRLYYKDVTSSKYMPCVSLLLSSLRINHTEYNGGNATTVVGLRELRANDERAKPIHFRELIGSNTDPDEPILYISRQIIDDNAQTVVKLKGVTVSIVPEVVCLILTFCRHIMVESTPSGPAVEERKRFKPSTTVFRMEDVSLRLLHDSTNERTAAIVARGSFTFGIEDIDVEGEHRKRSIHVENVEAYRCYPVSEKDTSISILPSSNLSILYAESEAAIALTGHVDEVHISFSYQDALLLLGVYTQVKVGIEDNLMSVIRTGEYNQEEDEEEEKVEDRSAIAKSAPPKSMPLNTRSRRNQGLPPIRQQSFSLEMKAIRFTLVDDSGGRYIPFVDIKVHHSRIFVSQIIPSLTGSVHLDIVANFYNSQLAKWEPLVEHWKIKVQVDQGQRISFSSSDFLDINVSKAFVDYLRLRIPIWSVELPSMVGLGGEAPIHSLMKPKKDENRQLHIMLENGTHKKLKWWFPQPGKPSSKHHVPHGKVVELELPNRSSSMYEWDLQRSLTLEIAGLVPDTRAFIVPLHKVGRYLVPLYRGKEVRKQVYAVYEVSLNGDTKLLRLRSNLVVKNTTTLPISVQLEYVRELERKVLGGPLQVGESRPLPLASPDSGVCIIHAKLEDGRCQYSSNGVTCDILGKEAMILECLCTGPACEISETHPFVESKAGDPSKVYVAVEHSMRTQRKVKGTEGDHEIAFSAPLILKNLLMDRFFYTLEDSKNGIVVKGTLDAGAAASLYYFNPFADEISLGIMIGGSKLSPMTKISGAASRKFMPVVDAEGRSIQISLEYQMIGASHVVNLFAQFWMVNRSGLPISLRQDSALERTDIMNPDAGKGHYAEYNPADWYEPNYETARKKYAKPVMLAFHSLDFGSSKLRVMVVNSKWSRPFSVDALGTGGVLSVKDKDGSAKGDGRQYELSVHVGLGPGKFYRTKVVTFDARYLLVNRTGRDVYYRQAHRPYKMLLKKGQSIPFHWLTEPVGDSTGIQISLGVNWYWSEVISVDMLAEQTVKLRHVERGEVPLYRVNVSQRGAVNYVLLCGEMEVPPYVIENATKYPLLVFQRACGTSQRIEPYSQIPYAWDNASKQRLLVAMFAPRSPEIRGVISDFQVTIALDIVQCLPDVCTKVEDPQMNEIQEMVVGTEVVADGPTHKLLIVDRLVHHDAADTGLLNKEVPEAAVGHSVFDLRVFFAGIGISIVDAVPQELMYITLTNCRFGFLYSEAEATQSMEISIEDAQIDNQLLSSAFPVLLDHVISGKESEPFFSIEVVRATNYPSVTVLRKFVSSLGEFNLSIDETFVLKMLAFLNIDTVMGEDEQMERGEVENRLLVSEESPSEGGMPIFFDILQIGQIKVNLSFQSQAGGEVLDNAVRAWLSTIGIGIPKIEEAPLQLSPLEIHHLFSHWEELVNSVGSHYKRQIILEAYKVFGSLHILGNPVSLVQNVGTGVKDFFYEPYQGLVKSPEALAEGVEKGARSLVKNSLFGVSNSAGNFTESAASGISKLSLSPAYQIDRERRAREKPKDIVDGVVFGARDLTKGLFDGMAGVAVEPLRGANKEGATGFLKGVGQGLLGIAVKPSVGVLDTFTRTAQGVKASAADNRSNRRRVRPPRYFGPDKVLEEYSVERALGQMLLYSIGGGKYMTDWYIFHVNIDDSTKLIVSNRAMLMVNVASDPPGLMWRQAYKKVISLQKIGGTQIRVQGKQRKVSTLVSNLVEDQLRHVRVDKTVSIPATEDIDEICQALDGCIRMAKADEHFQELFSPHSGSKLFGGAV